MTLLLAILWSAAQTYGVLWLAARGVRLALHVLRWVARWLEARRPVRCPLCADTERAALLYEPDQLTAHALTHDIEDVWQWTRPRLDGDAARQLDAAFEALQQTTTGLTEDPLTGSWSWICLRCDMTTETEFPTDRAAWTHRLLTHRCPL